MGKQGSIQQWWVSGASPTEAGSPLLRVALLSFYLPFSLKDKVSKLLPSMCKTNDAICQQRLLYSEITVFTLKTTKCKQGHLIREDL